MPYRRAAGILAAFLLIPQFLGAREVACPRHGEKNAVATTPAPMEGHAHHHESPGEKTTPGEHHPLPDCCPAMSTCSSGAAIQAVDNGLTLWSAPNDRPADVVTLSRSRVESPDPPPPKA